MRTLPLAPLLLAPLLLTVACGPSISYSPAAQAPSLPPTSPGSITVVELTRDAPDGVLAVSPGVGCELRVEPPARLLGTIEIGSQDEMFGTPVRSEERDQAARELAARHGGNVLAQCGSQYVVLAIDKSRPPGAKELLSLAAARVTKQGFVAEGEPSASSSGQIVVNVKPRMCYAVAFALEPHGAWGIHAKGGLRFNGYVAIGSGDEKEYRAEPVPAEGALPDLPFARARAGWQVLGCSLESSSGRGSLDARNPNAPMGHDVVVQLYSRPATDDELAATTKFWRDRERALREKMKLEEACAICAQYRCPTDYCASYDACLQRRGAYKEACAHR